MKNKMLRHIVERFSILALFIASITCALLVAGCSTTPSVKEESKPEPSPPPRTEAPRKPEMTIVLASLNLASRSTRFEKRDIQQLAAVLKKEQVEIFSVQNISRYPGLTGRIDFYNELSALIELRGKFGEMSNVSGRVRGNAVFSLYPTYGSKTAYFTGIRSANDEALLHVIVDAGVQTIGVISASIPPQATGEEFIRCLDAVHAVTKESGSLPTVVSGNLRPLNQTSFTARYSLGSPSAGKRADTAIWYTTGKDLTSNDSRSIETPLGILVLTHVGIFHPVTNDQRKKEP